MWERVKVVGKKDRRTADRIVPCKPRLVGGVKGHNMNEISFARILLATACPGGPAHWAESFK
jgi:hypothetical protein